jgi:acyl-homoserine lactone acylase PvdQ
VLRHVAEATLSSFVGGAAGNRAMDEATWTVAPYTQTDLEQQIQEGVRTYGAQGAQAISDGQSFVDGINAYVQKALLDPSLLPAEYAGIGKLPTKWSLSDLIALASLIGLAQGRGGGDELISAETAQAFMRRFGVRAGRAAWLDFREANDPEAPTTVSKRFPYETGPAFAPRGLAMPDPGSVRFVSPGATNPENAQSRDASGGALGRKDRRPARGGGGGPAGTLGYTDTPAPIAIPNDGSLGAALLYDFYGHRPHASNWELVSARHSSDRHAIAVMGPQVGYYVPEIPDGGGPPRTRDRRARRRLPRNQRLRPARPRRRLRVERDHRQLRRR